MIPWIKKLYFNFNCSPIIFSFVKTAVLATNAEYENTMEESALFLNERR